MANDNLISLIDALLDLDEKGALVPHGIGGHARTLLQRCKEELNTRPAAPVEGLETMGYVTPEWIANRCLSHTINSKPSPAWTEAVVTRSQAEAIVADWKRRAEYAERELANSILKSKSLEADNAALTAQVKEYVEARNDYEDLVCKKGSRIWPLDPIVTRHNQARVALEGQP